MSAIQIAGGFIDFQMGFAMANVIDPQTGAQSPLMGQYLYTIVFFSYCLSMDIIYYWMEFFIVINLFR